jgi:protocatechuate 3,4-dioxygenase beta subunit
MMVSCFGYGGLCITDPNGRYAIRGIPPGCYFVGADAGAENKNPYVTEYFGESLSPFLATLVPDSETEGAGLDEEPEGAIMIDDYLSVLNKSGWRNTHIIQAPLSADRFTAGLVAAMQKVRILGVTSRYVIVSRPSR